MPGETATVRVSIEAESELTHPMLLVEVGDRNGRMIHSVDTDKLGVPVFLTKAN